MPSIVSSSSSSSSSLSSRESSRNIPGRERMIKIVKRNNEKVLFYFFIIALTSFSSSSSCSSSLYFPFGCAAAVESTKESSSSSSLSAAEAEAGTCNGDDDGNCVLKEEEEECVDKEEDCAEWAENGECANNPNYMITHCPVSCKSCMQISSPLNDDNDPCIDRNPSCPKWATENECKNNPVYMKAFCARSCGTCPPLNPQKLEQELDEYPCTDLHEMCPTWAERGECLNNVKYMNNACPYSCWICVNAKESRERGDSEELIQRKRLFIQMNLGQTQTIPSHATKDQKTKALIYIKSMHSYATQNMTQPVSSSSSSSNNIIITPKMRSLCTNKLSTCSYLASQNHCQNNIVYMMEHCPLACLNCIFAEQFHTCAGRSNPAKPPAFIGMYNNNNEENDYYYNKELYRVGTIDAMFQRIQNNQKEEEFAKYKPEFLSSPLLSTNDDDDDDYNTHKQHSSPPPWLVRFDTFLSSDEADHLLQLSNTITWKDSKPDEVMFGSGNPTGISPRRDSKTASCKDSTASTENKQTCEQDDIYQTILQRISSVTQVPIEHFEPMELVKYSSSSSSSSSSSKFESYGVHHDYLIHDKWKPIGPRVLTMFLYLSDVEEGGATGFPDLDWLFVKPKKGQALLWSNVLSSDPTVKDGRMVHEGLPVVKGIKYGANVWIHLYDWKSQYDRDCV